MLKTSKRSRECMCTSETMRDALELPRHSEADPMFWIRLPRSRCASLWDAMDDPVAPSGRNLWRHPLVRRESGKVTGWECTAWIFTLNTSCFWSISVDDTKMTGKQENRSKTSARQKKKIDVEVPAPQHEAEVKDGLVMRQQGTLPPRARMSKLKRRMLKTSLYGATTCRVTLKIVWNACDMLCTRPLASSTSSQHLVSTIIK